MKKLLLFLIVATLLATAASQAWETKPLEASLVRLQLKESLPAFAPALENEPLPVQAVFLDYADDPVLLFKAQAALLKHPGLTRRILPVYGHEPEFREILRDHGDSILLPIDYFMNNKVRTLEVRRYIKRQTDRFLGPDDDTDETTAATAPDQATAQLTPEQRGWYAVHFILNEGHAFLGQFALDAQGKTRWIQSQRLLGETGSFFLGGIRALETKTQTGEKLGASDLAWAAVDVFVVSSTFKLLRIGKAAATGSRATAASRLARIGRPGINAAKYSAGLTTLAIAYIAARHPSMINNALATVAKFFDLPVLPTQMMGWILILLPLLYVGSWLMDAFLPP